MVQNDLTYLDVAVSETPSVDILGVNAYRGFHGFGRSFWTTLSQAAKKPVLITAYGAPAYAQGVDVPQVEELQALYHGRAWRDIESHLALGAGQGNALGGVAFEWLDNWRTASPAGPDGVEHRMAPEISGPFIDGNMYTEWFGIMSLGEKGNRFVRQPRKVFWDYLKLWKTK